jgi:F0F1-type ATP synthase epsilon subunit
MLRQSLIRITRHSAIRCFSAESATSVKLSFNLPHETIYNEAPVYQVIIPGAAGEYGVTANHVPYVAQLKPGVLQIMHEENSTEIEKYFVAGGYALTHPDSSTVGTPLPGWLRLRFCSFCPVWHTVLLLLNINNVQDVVCPEAVKLDDIDPAAVQKQYDAAKNAFSSAASGSMEQAAAQIDMEVNKAMGLALGLTLG